MRVTHCNVKPNPRYALAMAASDVIVPQSPKFALSKQEWKLAVEAEIKALLDKCNLDVGSTTTRGQRHQNQVDLQSETKARWFDRTF